MRTFLASLVVGMGLLGAAGLEAGEHLVSETLGAQRLAQAERERSADQGVVDELLATSAAREVVRRAGADMQDVQAGVAALSDAELADLAARARQLQSDPVAGLSSDVNDLLVVFLIVAIVVLVLKAV